MSGSEVALALVLLAGVEVAAPLLPQLYARGFSYLASDQILALLIPACLDIGTSRRRCSPVNISRLLHLAHIAHTLLNNSYQPISAYV